MPSSRVEVDTMTQSRASPNACSARRRSSTDSEECETKVLHITFTQGRCQVLHRPAAFAEDLPFLAAV